MSELLTAPDVARLLGLSLTKIYSLARSGEMRCYRFGDAVRFDAAHVKEYKESCQSTETRKRVASILNLTVSSKVKESGLESSCLALGIKVKPMRSIGRSQDDFMPSLQELSDQRTRLKMQLVSTSKSAAHS